MKKQTKVFATLSAAALLAVGVSAVSMAAGWDNSTGVWRYLDNNGDAVTDTWKSANGNWFYLDSDGVMATNQLIEDNNNNKTRYYYVDQYGAMVTNTWKAVAMDDTDSSDLNAEYWWYYFGSDGKAYTSEDDLTTSEIKTINGLKYAFDSEGHMLYGWVNKDNVEQQDDDDEAWKTSEYYFNGWNDGHMQTGWIKLTVEDDGDTEDYWFWFKNDGKKQMKRKKINGSYYHFDADDGHMITNWGTATQSAKDAATDNVNLQYLNGDGAERKNRWVWAVPDEDSIEDAMIDDYNDDEYRWWYFNNSGKLTANQIKKINGKKYAFDKYGRMLAKFVVDKSGSITKGGAASDVTRADVLAGHLDKCDISTGDKVYWFSNDEAKDGSMKKGYQNLELDDMTCQFYFNTSSGVGETKYNSKIKKYTINGLVLAPTNDDDSNYGAVVTNGEQKGTPTALVFGKATVGNWMVNKAGTLVKNKAKLKDNNDEYYVVSNTGKVLKWFASEEDYNSYVTYATTNDKDKKITISSAMLKECDDEADLDAAVKAAKDKAANK
jgi:glucan-binding YG repeat protein